jgi:hypothetical protein
VEIEGRVWARSARSLILLGVKDGEPRRTRGSSTAKLRTLAFRGPNGKMNLSTAGGARRCWYLLFQPLRRLPFAQAGFLEGRAAGNGQPLYELFVSELRDAGLRFIPRFSAQKCRFFRKTTAGHAVGGTDALKSRADT